MLGVVSETRDSGGNQTHDLHANSLAHYILEYQGTHSVSSSVVGIVAVGIVAVGMVAVETDQ